MPAIRELREAAEEGTLDAPEARSQNETGSSHILLPMAVGAIFLVVLVIGAIVG
jgi:hypothetical protein